MCPRYVRHEASTVRQLQSTWREEQPLLSTGPAAHHSLSGATDERAGRFWWWEQNKSLHTFPKDVYMNFRWADAARLDLLDEPDFSSQEVFQFSITKVARPSVVKAYPDSNHSDAHLLIRWVTPTLQFVIRPQLLVLNVSVHVCIHTSCPLGHLEVKQMQPMCY